MGLDNQPLTLGEFKSLMAVHEANDADLKNEMLTKFMSAFPDGDPLPHKQYHQSKIDAAKAEAAFWVAAKVKLFDRGIGGLLTVLWVIAGMAIFGLSVKLGLKLPFFSGIGG